MTQLDYFVFIVAGILGAWGHPVSSRVAWGVLGVWGLAKLLKVL